MAHIVFRDRLEAAFALAAALGGWQQTRALVLAISWEVLPMARLIADALGAELRLAGVPAIRASVPVNAVVAVGSVQAGTCLAMGAAPPEAGSRVMRQVLLDQAVARRARCGTCASAGITHRVAIVIDDGMATPEAVEATLRMVRAYGPARLVYTVPIMVADTLERTSRLADECVYLVATHSVKAVAAHYLEYPVVTDRQAVLALLPTPLWAGHGDGTCAACLSVAAREP